MKKIILLVVYTTTTAMQGMLTIQDITDIKKQYTRNQWGQEVISFSGLIDESREILITKVGNQEPTAAIFTHVAECVMDEELGILHAQSLFNGLQEGGQQK